MVGNDELTAGAVADDLITTLPMLGLVDVTCLLDCCIWLEIPVGYPAEIYWQSDNWSPKVQLGKVLKHSFDCRKLQKKLLCNFLIWNKYPLIYLIHILIYYPLNVIYLVFSPVQWPTLCNKTASKASVPHTAFLLTIALAPVTYKQFKRGWNDIENESCQTYLPIYYVMYCGR